MSDIPWDKPCEKHDNLTYLSSVPSQWRDCYGCFLDGRATKEIAELKEKLKIAEEALNEIAVEWGEDIDEVAISCGRSFATIAAIADEALKKIRGEDDQT